MKTQQVKQERNYESPPINPFLHAVNRIVEVCIERQAYFETRPKILACWMDIYTELSYASRFLEDYYYETGNPKDALIELEGTVSEAYANLVYDAWGATIDVMSRSERDEKIHPLESKMNKTADEYLQMMLDPEYRYNTLFPCRLRAINHLLCTLGAGRAWNRDGFICDKAPSGTDGDQYIGYEAHKDELPADLKRMAADWFTEPTIARGVAMQLQVREEGRAKRREQDEAFETLKALVKSRKLKGKDKKFADDLLESLEPTEPAYSPQDVYPMSEEHCLLCTMPDNAHESYLRIGQEISQFLLQDWEFDWESEKKKYLSQVKESDKKHHIKRFEENRKIARKFLKRFPLPEKGQ